MVQIHSPRPLLIPALHGLGDLYFVVLTAFVNQLYQLKAQSVRSAQFAR